MCSYCRCSFLLTPRRRRPLGMSSPPGFANTCRSVLMRRTDRVLPSLGRVADLLLRPIQHVLGPFTDRTDRVGGALACAGRSALGILTDLFAPVPDDEPSHERSQDESKHRRPPFSLRRSVRRLDEAPHAFRRESGVPRLTRTRSGWKSCARGWTSHGPDFFTR